MLNSNRLGLEVHRVLNVETPYKGAVPGKLAVGTKVFARVKINPNPRQFIINLETDAGVALHFNPRFDQAVTVCNSFVSGRWGKEARANQVPFEQENSYGIEINVHADKFEMVVNGEHLIDFEHVLPFQSVQSLSVKGDIEVMMIVYHG
jgi:hypothetical protein